MLTRDDLLSGIIYIRARDYLEQVNRAPLVCLPYPTLCAYPTLVCPSRVLSGGTNRRPLQASTACLLLCQPP